MKKKKHPREEILQIRVTEYEKNRITGLASIYAKGNTSLFVVHAAMNAPRVFITNDDRVNKMRRVKP